MTTTPINILIDNQACKIKDVVSCQMGMAEGAVAHTISVEFASKRLWEQCNPETDRGELRLKLIVGSTIYQFLLEERNTDVRFGGIGFTVWGRSAQALITESYSQTVTDTDETSHPWQSGAVLVSEIITHILNNYTDGTVSVSWNVEDYIVHEGTFQPNNLSPMAAIQHFVEVAGADLVPGIDGNLSVEVFDVEADSTVQAYNDIDDIVQLSESRKPTKRYNSVTVYGHGAGNQKNSFIAVERLTTESIRPNRQFQVRVYYFHSTGDELLSYSEDAAVAAGSTGQESVTESIQVQFGVGHRSKPNLEGEYEITGDTTVPLDTVSETYDTQYQDFWLRGGAGDQAVMFYFEDKSQIYVYSFSPTAETGDGSGDYEYADDLEQDYEEGGGSEQSSLCNGLVLEVDGLSTDPLQPGDMYVRLYNPRFDYPSGGDNSAGGSVEKTNLYHPTAVLEEQVQFQNGVGQVDYPVYEVVTVLPKGGFAAIEGQTARGSRYIRCPSKAGENFTATVRYRSSFQRYKTNVPATYRGSNFEVWFEVGDCAIISVNRDVAASLQDDQINEDVTLTVIDNASEAELSGVSVSIDGTSRGTTNASGQLQVTGLAVGTHTIELTKSGYDTYSGSFVVSQT
jgi:hypothetical protein